MYQKFQVAKIVFLLLSPFFCRPVSGYQVADEKLISLHAVEIPLREILHDLSNKTDIKFVYCDKGINPHKVTCKIIERPLGDVLNIILSGTNINYKFITERTVVLFPRSHTPKIHSKPPEIRYNHFKENYMRPPIQKNSMEINYPLKAIDQGLEGRVAVKMHISEEGRVKDVKIINSSGHCILDEAARKNALKFTFRPAMQGDHPVDIWISRDFNYVLDDSDLVPVHYLQKIASFSKKLTGRSQAAIRNAQWRLLRVHDEYCRFFTQSGDLSNNKIIKLVVSSKVCEDWKEWWSEGPLYFLVFHDFMLKYPDTEYREEAIIKLRYYIELALNKLQNQASAKPKQDDKINRFIEYVRTFLTDDYPDENLTS